MYLAELIPELVELRVVGAPRDVAELVEHGVEHLLVGDEVVVPSRAPQPQLHLDSPAPLATQQPRVLRPDPPTTESDIRNKTDQSPRKKKKQKNKTDQSIGNETEIDEEEATARVRAYENSERTLTRHLRRRMMGWTCLATRSRSARAAGSSGFLLSARISHTLCRSPTSIAAAAAAAGLNRIGACAAEEEEESMGFAAFERKEEEFWGASF